jgi:hypothetical protein
MEIMQILSNIANHFNCVAFELKLTEEDGTEHVVTGRMVEESTAVN